MLCVHFTEHIQQSYITFFENVSIGVRKIRKLPNYESVLMFDFVLNDFMNNCTIEERKQYLPVFLWWKITSIIPLRPCEFLDLKSNCTFIKKESYWITVPRKKQDKNMYGVEITNSLKINQEIYNLITEYLLLQTADEKSEYLMSYIAYNSFITARSRKNAKKRRLRIDKVDRGQMDELLDDFYINVVEQKYEYKNVERVKLGDTRHFAFCNMMLQGFNMLSIARIGGHKHLKSQLTYTRHLDYFAEARIKILSEQIKKNRDRDIGDTFLSETNGLIVKSKLDKHGMQYRSIQNGFCSDYEFPNNCIDDCVFCNYFRLDLSKPNAIKELSRKSSNINQNIKDQIQTMSNIFG